MFLDDFFIKSRIALPNYKFSSMYKVWDIQIPDISYKATI